VSFRDSAFRDSAFRDSAFRGTFRGAFRRTGIARP
jgi:hypothetical protein